MKRYFVFFLAALLVLLGGCEKGMEEHIDTINENSYITRVYQLGFSETTKTSVDSLGKVNWEAGDVIRYYSAKNGQVKECTVLDKCSKTSLPFEVESNASFIVAEYGGASIVENTSGNSFVIKDGMSKRQSGKFEDAHIAVAKSYDVNVPSLTFHNISSLIKFSFKRDDVARVVFSNNSDNYLISSDILVSFSGEIPTVSSEKANIKEISVNVGGSGTFYISLLPVTMPWGFTMKLYDSTGVYLGKIRTSKSQTLKQNSILNLGTLDTRVVAPYEPNRPSSPDISYRPNLSEKETANCYIVPVEGDYYFDATVRGNSTYSKITDVPVRARTLWESFGTDVTPSEGEIINNVYYENGKVHFTSTGKNGNAVIAIENRDEDILWSWHIWCCMGYDADYYAVTYNNDAGVMMDRNLGATSSTPGDVHALGLFYQWGRKDPFLAGASITSDMHAASTGNWKTAYGGYYGTIEYAIKNPTTFLLNNESNSDWLSGYDTDMSRWPEGWKYIYDPCPPGYMIPEKDFWSNALDQSVGDDQEGWIADYHGFDFGKSVIPLGRGIVWYPAAGHYREINYPIGYYWTSSSSWYRTTYIPPERRRAAYFTFGVWGYGLNDWGSKGNAGASRSMGFSVRCRAVKH